MWHVIGFCMGFAGYSLFVFCFWVALPCPQDRSIKDVVMHAGGALPIALHGCRAFARSLGCRALARSLWSWI